MDGLGDIRAFFIPLILVTEREPVSLKAKTLGPHFRGDDGLCQR